MENLKLHEIIQKSEALEEINWTHICHKKEQLKAYYREPLYFVATFVANAVQLGIIIVERHVSEAIYELAEKHLDDVEEMEYLVELYSSQTALL